ncbi:MAG: hypothetical protein R3C02_01635 [Planctomycetaceae bacterium]
MTDQLDLRDAVTACELDMLLIDVLERTPVRSAASVPQHAPDLNFLLDDKVSWQELERIVQISADHSWNGSLFVDQYRGKQICSQEILRPVDRLPIA